MHSPGYWGGDSILRKVFCVHADELADYRVDDACTADNIHDGVLVMG